MLPSVIRASAPALPHTLPVAAAAFVSILFLGAAPARASGPPPSAGEAPHPTPAQRHILHLMDPALHAGLGHPHGPPPGAHDCPHDCDACDAPGGAQHGDGAIAGGGPKSDAEAPRATISGTLTIKVASGTYTLALTDVVHAHKMACMWPVGGTIHLTDADGQSHTASFSATCGSVLLDGAALNLPTRHEHNGGHHGRGAPPPEPH